MNDWLGPTADALPPGKANTKAPPLPADLGVDMILALDDKMWAGGERPAALALLRQGLRRYPGEPRLMGRLARTATSLADWRDGAIDIAAVIAAGRDALSAMWALCLADDPTLHRACAADHAAHMPVSAAPGYLHSLAQDKPLLRIGYLTADFREHPMSQCTAELFERHDRRRVAITGYSLGKDDGSPLRRRIEAGFDCFVDLAGCADAEAAARIHADAIDILVELIGYTTFNGCGIMALRPAPIQVSLLGFPGTKATPFIDYLVGDPIVCGDGAAEHYTERLALLPETYFPNDSRKAIASPPPTRKQAGLPAQGFVFCCFNYPQKITPDMFDRWMRLLRGTRGALLWLLDAWPGVADNLRREAAARGADPERLIFAPRLPLADHLARLSLADLALDTLPCGAHTTASDALWAGVPMITCLGKSFAGRVGATLLNAIGLPELIAPDLEAYEALALRLAHEPDRLAGLRRRLAANRLTAPLFDCARYTRHLEAAYATMWAIHCNGCEPRSFGVLPRSDQGSGSGVAAPNFSS